MLIRWGIALGLGAALLVPVMTVAGGCGAGQGAGPPAADAGLPPGGDDGGAGALVECDAGVYPGSAESELTARCISRSDVSLFFGPDRIGYLPPSNPKPSNSANNR